MSDLINVCVDDERILGDIQIRNPRVAIAALRRLHKQIGVLYMDNDMGGGWEHEGRNILKQFLTDCRNQRHYPHTVHVVTSNTPARQAMSADLEAHGYRKIGVGSYQRG